MILTETALLNVAIIPSDDVASDVALLSRDLQRHGGIFEIDNTNRFAHLTIYMARFSSDKLHMVQQALSDLTQLRQMALQHTGFHLTPGDYYEVSYNRTPELLALHTAITHALSSMRYSPGSPIREEYFGIYSPEQQRNAENCGYDLADDLYRPHITITRLGGKPVLSTLEALDDDLSFQAVEIGLFLADNLGAATKRISTYSLSRHEHG